MLVLSRRIGETIVINGDIQVKVLSVQGNKVRLGVVAPENVSVDRQEVHERRAAFTEGAPVSQQDALLSN
jgi:carbon storage regulator